MRAGVMYLLAGIFLVLIVSIAWWTREFPASPQVQTHVVQPGETAAAIATAFGISPAALAEANRAPEAEGFAPEPGDVVLIPVPNAGRMATIGVHAAGLGAEVLGVFMSFWLAVVSGILPKGLRRQVLGIAIVLGVVSYSATHALDVAVPELSPQFIFAAIKDGFAWSAAFPMFARAFGVRERLDA